MVRVEERVDQRISQHDNIVRSRQAGRRHRIGERRVRHVIEQPLVSYLVPAPTDEQDERTLYLGDDQTGQALEVLTVPLESGGLLVVHAMDLREKYRPEYEAAKAERRCTTARQRDHPGVPG